MPDSTALIHAIQSAVKATELQAHRILDCSDRLVAFAHQYDLAHDDARAIFLRTWRDLCEALQRFWGFYAGRSYGGVFIPHPFRPHDFLAGVARTSEAHGVIGRSISHIAFKYGLEVRWHIRGAVPRATPKHTHPPDRTQSALVVEVRQVEPNSQGGFGFPIPDDCYPAVQATLRKLSGWGSTTVERVKIEVTQEVNRAWAQVPVTVRAMSTQSREPDGQELGENRSRNGVAIDAPPPLPPAAVSPVPPPGPRWTLGTLITFLDGIEHRREFSRLNQQEQLRRNPLSAAANATYASALRWRPNEQEMPGIGRIELLCDLEPGEAGVNAAKVRRLRARICRERRWQLPQADGLTLDEAAGILEGGRRVTLDERQCAGEDAFDPESDARVRLADPSRCPECSTPPNPLDLAAGGTARCRGCGLWGLDTGTCLLPGTDSRCPPVSVCLHAPYWQRLAADPPRRREAGGEPGSQPDRATPAGNQSPARSDPVIDETELAVLGFLRDRHPVTVFNVDIEAAVNLSKQKVGEVVTGLIGKKLVTRPKGKRKGVALTPEGRTLVDRIRKSSADHP
jgi:hypothetical protein